MTRSVTVESGRARYVQDISVGPHMLLADEPFNAGGSDAGPTPYELLLAALGACTSMTVRMYADRKQWPLQDVHVELSYAGVHAKDCADCDSGSQMVTEIEMDITFDGDLSEDQRTRLLEIASKCPVHRTLTSPIQIVARPAHAFV